MYLGARRDESLDGRYTLTTNWRADGAVRGRPQRPARRCDLRGPGHRLPHREPGRGQSGSHDAGARRGLAVGAPLRLAPKSGLPQNEDGKVEPERVNRMVERDVAAHVRGLLEQASIPTSRDDSAASAGAVRRRRPGDRLAPGGGAPAGVPAEGIPAVVAGSGSVLASDAATHVRYLLEAMEQPGDLRRVRTYALSRFEGWSVAEVAAADDRALAGLQERLSRWTARLADRPVVEVLAQVWPGDGRGRAHARPSGRGA